MEEEKGASACRDCGALLESILREHALLLYALMRYGKDKILVPAELRIAAGNWDARPFLGMNTYLSWLRAAASCAHNNQTIGKVVDAFLLDRRLLADLGELARLRNSYAHKSREVPRVEARSFLDGVTKAIEKLAAARRSYTRAVVTDVSDTIKLHTSDGEREFAPARKFSSLGNVDVGNIVYCGDEAGLSQLLPVLGQCDECHSVDAIREIVKKNRYTCSNAQCRYSNALEDAWEFALRRSNIQANLSRRTEVKRLPPPSVFISYASEDRAIAANVAQQLQRKGVKVWMGEKNVDPGDILVEKIAEGLQSAQYGILLISEHFLNKNWTKTELEFLLHKSIETRTVKLIPVCLGVTHTDIVKRFPLLRGIVSLQFTTEVETLRKIASVIFGSVSAR